MKTSLKPNVLIQIIIFLSFCLAGHAGNKEEDISDDKYRGGEIMPPMVSTQMSVMTVILEEDTTLSDYEIEMMIQAEVAKAAAEAKAAEAAAEEEEEK